MYVCVCVRNCVIIMIGLRIMCLIFMLPGAICLHYKTCRFSRVFSFIIIKRIINNSDTRFVLLSLFFISFFWILIKKKVDIC